jgi:hypothetical protein
MASESWIIPAPDDVEGNIDALADVAVDVRGDVDLSEFEGTDEATAAYQDPTGRFVVEQSSGGQLVFGDTGDASQFETILANLPGDRIDALDIDEATGDVGTGLSEAEAVDVLSGTDIRASGEELTREDLAAYVDAGLDSERTFTSRQNGRVSVTLYDEDRTRPVEGVPTIEFLGGEGAGPVREFLGALRTVGPESVDPDAIGRSEELIDRAEDRDVRRETRQAGREAAEAAGVDLDEFGIGATAEGEVIVQDRDSGRTRTIDADAPGGVGSAIDAATGNGQFVADDADPAAGASGSGDGLGARAAGVVVLLFGALAAALGWLS